MGRGPHSEAARRLGERIRVARRASGLTQAELGRPLSKSFVSAVEHGAVVPSLGALWLFASRLGLPLSELLHDEQEMTAQYNPAHGEDECRTYSGEPRSRS